MRALIVDDGLLIREGIRMVLEAGGVDVVGMLGSTDELFDVLRSGSVVDVVVLDIRMPPTHTDEGLRALEQLRSARSRVGVLLLSMYSSTTLALRAAAGGPGTGYLLKERIADGRALVDAVETVARGGTVLDPEVVDLLVRGRNGRTDLAALSRREHEVLGYMAEGLSNAGIATRLSVSVKTIETHVGSISAKLGVESTAEEHRRVLTVLRALSDQRQ